MREIKFRCWFNDFMYYAIPSIKFNKDGGYIVDLNQDPEDFCRMPDTWADDYDSVLMQYTGIKNRNGTEIYEGDIFKAPCDFGPGGFVDRIASVPINHHMDIQWQYFLLEEVEVIGNIYENPGLL